MAEKTISSSIVQGKTFPPQALDSVALIQDGGAFLVSSKDVALHFQKKHKHVLDEIHKIRSLTPKPFYEPNFRPIEIDVLLPHSGGIRKDPAFLLTRDAFSLLAMGFTGKAAIQWKLRYIEAFNALERAALAKVHNVALQEGMRLHKRLTDERITLIKKALAYDARGFYHTEIAKMLDCSHDKARKLLHDGRLLGLQPCPPNKEARHA